MEVIDDLLTHVKDATAELKKKKQQGIRIVGYTPGEFFPEELAHACGAAPVALLRGGDHEAVIAAGPYLARFLDTFCRSQISYRMLGDEPIYQMVDLMVAMIGDNHIRSIAESWEYWTDVEIFKLAVPANKTKHGFEYYLNNIYRLKDKLEALTGTRLEESKLKEEINLTNRMRELLNRISWLRKQECPRISGKQFMMLNHASYFVDRNIMVEVLETILQELEKKVDDKPKSPRVMIVGSTLAVGDFKLVDLLEESGAAIVFEDFTEGMRQYSQKIEANGDLMQGLAQSYFMKRLPPAYFKPATSERFAYFLDKAREFKVNGIVWYSLMYRDCHDMEGFLFENTARDKGLSVLKINSDYDYGEKEPLRTRIETFTEMIREGAD